MPTFFLSGSSGRLGSVILSTLEERGDKFLSHRHELNYMIFAHRYRGPESFDAEIESNVKWIAELIDAAKWGQGDKAIVIVSSVNALQPALNQSLAYNLSKAALNNLARYYAVKQDVRINTVSPDTFTGDNPGVLKQQVANVIAFLCSAESSGINGQDILITGKRNGLSHA